MKTRTILAALAFLVASGVDVGARQRLYRVVKASPDKPYSHIIKMKIGPFDVSPTADREVCQWVELPYLKELTSCIREKPDAPETCGLPILGYKVRLGGGTSHHFIVWAYEGSADGAAKFPPGIHDSKACLDFGPVDSINTRQVAGVQTRRVKVLLPDGLGQQVRAFTDASGTPKGIGIILNSHYVGDGKRAKGLAHVELFVARPGVIRAYGKLVFDVFASAFIDVPPGAIGKASGDWEVGGPTVPLAAAGIPPQNDACVLLLTTHMHKRGVLFTTDLVDASGSKRLYDATDYAHPPVFTFAPVQLMKRGMRFHYECTHDNGVARPVKMGCELEPGVAPGAPVYKVFLDNGRIDGSARSCATDADCAGIGTGRCVPARLVFGFTGNDEMCILPGTYYDAIPGAPPGRECDLSLLPPLG
jgi:hypothetical protein